MKKVSISDIARKAGVSVSTVSFVMNDKAVKMRISREVIEKVENVAREIFRRLKSFPSARLERVRIEETSKNSFEIRDELEEVRG